MPILLDTHYTAPGKHGADAIDYSMVLITKFALHTVGRRVILTLQYGNVVNGAWISKDKPFIVSISNCPEQVEMGINPETSEPENVVTCPADMAFDDMREDFAIVQGDVDLKGYDVVSNYLYNYLITNGYYTGILV